MNKVNERFDILERKATHAFLPIQYHFDYVREFIIRKTG